MSREIPVRVVIVDASEGKPTLRWQSTGQPLANPRVLTVNPIRPGERMTGFLIFADGSSEHVFIATPEAA